MTNPYLEWFLSLPATCRRNRALPVDSRELLMPTWLELKYQIGSTFSWAVPTEEAIQTILRNTRRIVEIGCGSGYWAWLLHQRGAQVVAFDTHPPVHIWHPVGIGDEREAARFPNHALFLCWPPWESDMAFNALRYYHGDLVVFVGEWMRGCANARFFSLLISRFDCIDSTNIPQWFMRDDKLLIFRRRTQGYSRQAVVLPASSPA